jgi:S-(hydroxymethyl)glutathione dehydrogenase/alcohol dehydrogenase
MKSKCAVVTGINEVKVVELGVPVLRGGHVLVKIDYAGICGSQINEIRGKHSKYIPHLMGHEAVGVVVDVGKNVKKVSSGDRVIVTWINMTGAGEDGSCYDGYNAGPVTAFQEYAVVSENKVVKVPPSLVYNDSLVLLGCAIPTGYGSVLNYGIGKTIRVFGIGNIGAIAILGAKKLGYTVYAVDIDINKIEYAKTLGADYASNPYVDLEPVDCAIDTTGNTGSIATAFRTLNNSGKLIIVGNTVSEESIKLSLFDFIKGKSVVGSWGGGIKNDCELLSLANLDVSKIPIIKYKLDHINEAIKAFVSGSCGKIILECG